MANPASMDTSEAAAAPSSAVVPFDAFLSYATRGNYLLCRRVEAFLEGFHRQVPSAEGPLRALHICRDGSDFRQWLTGTLTGGAEPVWQRIEHALQRSQRLIVFCSPETAASPWVNREVEWMLKERGEDAVWLAMTAGDDPAGRPEGLVPPAAISAGLHVRQIWYDLRQWRGVRGERVRNAEDEMVRMALDLLDLASDQRPGLAAVWQREEARRARRQASLLTAAAGAIALGATVAGWQFLAARDRALQAQASSLVRVAEAALDRSPLIASLVAGEWQPKHVPSDALATGWRLIGSEVPESRLRWHSQALIGAGWTPQGRLWAVDRGGSVSLSTGDGRGDPGVLRSEKPIEVAAVASSSNGEVLWIAQKQGLVQRVRIADSAPVDAGIACRLPMEDARYLWASPIGGPLVVSGYKNQAYVCSLAPEERSAQVLPLGGSVVHAWFDEGTSAWQLVTDVGEICDVGIASKDARTAPMAHAQFQATCVRLGDVGQVKLAAAFGKRALALSTEDSVWLGRHLGTKWVLERLTGAGAADSLSFSVEGERLAVAEKGKGSVSVFRSATAELLTTLDHSALFFLDPVSAETLADRPSRPKAFPVSDLAWSPDGRTLATLQDSQGVRLWAVAPGASAQPRRLKGHFGAEWLKWSQDGTRLLSAGDDGDLWVWTLSGALRQRHMVLNQRVYAAALRPRDQLLAVVGDNNDLLLLDAGRLDRPVRRILAPSSCKGNRGTERHLDAAVGFDPQGRLWWLHRDGGVSAFPAELAHSGSLPPNAVRHQCTGALVATIVPAASKVALVNELQQLAVLDESGLKVLDQRAVDGPPTSIGASADGQWIGVGSRNGEVVRWKLGNAADIKRSALQSHKGAVQCIALAAETGGVLSAGQDGLALWQSGSSSARSWNGDGGGLEQCAVRGEVGFVSAQSGRLWALDLTGRRPPLRFESRDGVTHIGPLSQLMVSSGEDFIVTGGGVDGQVSVWHAEQGRRLTTAFMGGTLTGLAFDPGRRRLIAVGEGGRVANWPLDIDGVQADISAATNANLMPSERAELLGEPSDAAYEAYSTLERRRGRTPLERDWRFKLPF